MKRYFATERLKTGLWHTLNKHMSVEYREGEVSKQHCILHYKTNMQGLT